MPVEGGAADVEGGGDGGQGVCALVVELAGDGQLVGGHGSGAAAGAASGSGDDQTGGAAFADEG